MRKGTSQLGHEHDRSADALVIAVADAADRAGGTRALLATRRDLRAGIVLLPLLRDVRLIRGAVTHTFMFGGWTSWRNILWLAWYEPGRSLGRRVRVISSFISDRLVDEVIGHRLLLLDVGLLRLHGVSGPAARAAQRRTIGRAREK